MRRFADYWQMRLMRVWWIVKFGDTWWAEVVSGASLLILRGIMLLFAPRSLLPLDVQFRLYPITENRWATYIMTLGALQILFAGSRHSTIRLCIKIGILTGFVVVGVAAVQEGHVFSAMLLSVITMSAFYVSLMVRVFRDRRAGVKSLDERMAEMEAAHHAHTSRALH